MQKPNNQPAGLASIPAKSVHLPLYDLRDEVIRCLSALDRATPAERDNAERAALKLAHFITWIVSDPVSKAYGREAGECVGQWAVTLRTVANGLQQISAGDFPESIDRTALILDNIENMQRQLAELAIRIKAKPAKRTAGERRAA